MTEKIVILGSGPAGYTAAIYCARSGLQPLLIEGLQPGGQLTITTDVENFPGFPKGIQGPELMQAMRGQAERLGTRIMNGEVSGVDLKKRPFTVTVEGREYQCQALIVATGASARWLNIKGEKELRGKGVSACATCDGPFFKGQDVVVVGGGDTALEEALYLTHFARSVTVIHRRDKLRAANAMQERVRANPKISFLWNSVITDIKDVPSGRVASVEVKDVKSGSISEVPCSGVFVAVGHAPNTALFRGKLKMDDGGYIVTLHGSTATSVEGVFAAGDVADPRYRQAATAVGTGCMAAIDAERWIGSV